MHYQIHIRGIPKKWNLLFIKWLIFCVKLIKSLETRAKNLFFPAEPNEDNLLLSVFGLQGTARHLNFMFSNPPPIATTFHKCIQQKIGWNLEYGCYNSLSDRSLGFWFKNAFPGFMNRKETHLLNIFTHFIAFNVKLKGAVYLSNHLHKNCHDSHFNLVKLSFTWFTDLFFNTVCIREQRTYTSHNILSDTSLKCS